MPLISDQPLKRERTRKNMGLAVNQTLKGQNKRGVAPGGGRKSEMKSAPLRVIGGGREGWPPFELNGFL